MIVLHSAGQLLDTLAHIKDSGKKIGFVPTMGALHNGHISLINKAKEISDCVVASIFVNPAQFNNPEDLNSYPRTVESDEQLLASNGCDVLFLPEEREIYPSGYFDICIELPLGSLNQVMEAEYRPGHFEGVIAVVYRLFELVQPEYAFFGEKDFQQLLIVKKLAQKYFPTIKVISVPTIREPGGLALSSRNMRLTPYEKAQATEIYKGLIEVKKMVQTTVNDLDFEKCRKIFENHLKIHAPIIKIEYFLIADQRTLLSATHSTPLSELRAFTAVYVNNIRLIDNIKLF
ncbi:MAG: pantoate--beta-alanine ligase [Thermaurantimonas sp.]